MYSLKVRINNNKTISVTQIYLNPLNSLSSSLELSNNKFHSSADTWSSYGLFSGVISGRWSNTMLSSSSLSNYRKSSSMPSMALEMPHFLNDFCIDSVLMFSHDFTTHSQTVVSDAARIFPALVKVWSPETIHLFQHLRRPSLKGLFRHTSNPF